MLNFGLPLLLTEMTLCLTLQMPIRVTQCKRTLVVLGQSPDLSYCIRVQCVHIHMCQQIHYQILS